MATTAEEPEVNYEEEGEEGAEGGQEAVQEGEDGGEDQVADAGEDAGEDASANDLELLQATVHEARQDLDEDAEKLKQFQELQQQHFAMGTPGGPGASNEAKEEVDARSIFVGNVDFQTTEQELQALFKDCGVVRRITILRDKFSGRSKGFSYVEFTDPGAVSLAIALNDSVFKGRQIKVTPKRTNVPFMAARGRGRGRGRARGRGYGYAPRSRGRARARGGFSVYFSPTPY